MRTAPACPRRHSAQRAERVLLRAPTREKIRRGGPISTSGCCHLGRGERASPHHASRQRVHAHAGPLKQQLVLVARGAQASSIGFKTLCRVSQFQHSKYLASKQCASYARLPPLRSRPWAWLRSASHKPGCKAAASEWPNRWQGLAQGSRCALAPTGILPAPRWCWASQVSDAPPPRALSQLGLAPPLSAGPGKEEGA